MTTSLPNSLSELVTNDISSDQQLEIMQQLKKVVEKVAESTNGGEATSLVHIPRVFFSGKESSLTNLDVFSEHIMNVYDASTDNDGMEIDLHLYGQQRGATTSSIIIYDNGPGFNTDSSKDFFDTFLKYRGDNKFNSTKKFVGTAGVGAKEANAKLGGKHIYEWSDGKGKQCKVVVDEDSFEDRVDYVPPFETEDWDGSSFFRQTITKLWNPSQKMASEIRAEISEKFAGKLKEHPAVKIYTCGEGYKGGSEALEPIDRVVAVKGFDESFNITLNGATASVRIRLSDPDTTMTNPSSWGAPWIKLARFGIIHTDTKERGSDKIYNYLFDDATKSKLKSTTAMHLRNIFIIINCDEFKPTQIKNDLNLDVKQTQEIMKAIGGHPQFKSMIDKIEQWNRQNHSATKTVAMSAKLVSNLEKMCKAAGVYIGQTLTNYGCAGQYTINKNANASVRKIKCVDTADDRKKKNYTPKAPVSKISSSNKIGGRNFDFNISFASLGKDSRYSLDIMNNVANLTINESYEGFTKMCPNYERATASSKELMLYVADTFGLGVQDLVIKERIENNNQKLVHADWSSLTTIRDNAVVNCINSVF